jgi:hypothetical protein
MTYRPPLVLAVEDELSGAVLRRLLDESDRGFAIDRLIIGRGFGQLKAGIPKYRTASRALPHVVLTDLDRYVCPRELLADWRATRLPSSMLLRIAVREVEAWLLADRAGIANFLCIPTVKVPVDPEAIPDPKQALINLARKSRRRRFAEELVPATGSAAPIGPMYNTHLAEFASTRWNVASARGSAASLDRAMNRLGQFMAA